VRQVNLTVQASTGDLSDPGSALTSKTTLNFELIGWSAGDEVGGLAWECADQWQASVPENSPADSHVTTLTAYDVRVSRSADTSSRISYHIVNGDPQRVFNINSLTVSRSSLRHR